MKNEKTYVEINKANADDLFAHIEELEELYVDMLSCDISCEFDWGKATEHLDKLVDCLKGIRAEMLSVDRVLELKEYDDKHIGWLYQDSTDK